MGVGLTATSIIVLEPIREPSGTVPISGTTAAVVGPGSGHHAAWSGLSPSPGRFSNTLLVGWVRR